MAISWGGSSSHHSHFLWNLFDCKLPPNFADDTLPSFSLILFSPASPVAPPGRPTSGDQRELLSLYGVLPLESY